MNRSVLYWTLAGVVGWCLLPWYTLDDGLWSFEWLVDGYPLDTDYAPALFLVGQGEKLWLLPPALFLLLPFLLRGRDKNDPFYGRILLIAGIEVAGLELANRFALPSFVLHHGYPPRANP